MPQSVRIDFTSKTQFFEAHRRLSEVGGWNADGSLWRLTVAEAVAGVGSRWWFYVARPGYEPVPVLVACGESGALYLRTANDGIHPNNLLALPDFPERRMRA